jgi:hypothetical protein
MQVTYIQISSVFKNKNTLKLQINFKINSLSLTYKSIINFKLSSTAKFYL